jgi:hypothetical protein
MDLKIRIQSEQRIVCIIFYEPVAKNCQTNNFYVIYKNN